ncbi:MAG: hypothetical protein HQL28_03175 [Candidatus Omnitrophica bacterium]|nr:hypothetical protein [Candidatus Omnitrophota bacterium]
MKKTNKRTSVMKRTVSGIGEKMSSRADRVADIILDKSETGKNDKSRKIKDETISMFKDVVKLVKSNVKEVHAKDFVSDAAYGLGQLSGMFMRGCRGVYDYFNE